MRLIVTITCLVIWSSGAPAQTIFPRGIVNAASFVPPGLPGGAIAQGSVFGIFGKNLGPSTSPGLAFPLSRARQLLAAFRR